MHAFWLVLTYDLLEDRRIDDVIIKTLFNSLLYKTNMRTVHVQVREVCSHHRYIKTVSSASFYEMIIHIYMYSL